MPKFIDSVCRFSGGLSFRGDIIRIIGNLSYRNKEAQDEVYDLGTSIFFTSFSIHQLRWVAFYSWIVHYRWCFTFSERMGYPCIAQPHRTQWANSNIHFVSRGRTTYLIDPLFDRSKQYLTKSKSRWRLRGWLCRFPVMGGWKLVLYAKRNDSQVWVWFLCFSFCLLCVTPSKTSNSSQFRREMQNSHNSLSVNMKTPKDESIFIPLRRYVF